MEELKSFLEYGGMGLAALIFLGGIYTFRQMLDIQTKNVSDLAQSFANISKEYSTTVNNHLDHMRQTIENSDKVNAKVGEALDRNTKIFERIEDKLNRIT